jgi:hypothetical protein
MVDPQSRDRRTEDGDAAAPTGLTGEEHQSDWCATTQSGIFEDDDTRWDRMAYVEAKQRAVTGHPSDGENLKISKPPLRVLYP